MLKYPFSCTLLLFTIIAGAQSPTFQINSIVEKDVQKVLQKQFYNYQLYRLPVAAIHRHVSTADRADFKLNNNQGINWNVELQAYDIRSDNYKLRAPTSNKVREFNKGENITYRGLLANVEGSDVRLTITPSFFYGLVQTNNTTYYIEPLSYFVENATADQFVFYQEADVIPGTGKTCGVTETQRRKIQIETAGKKKQNENTLSALGPCFDVEIAIASDFSMYTKYGNSILNVQNHNIAVMNNVQTNYDDEFNNNLNFVIVENFVSNCSTCDPWTSSTDAEVLLDDFTDWGNDGGFSTTYDVAQHWTNRNFDGPTIGIAWVGAICTNVRYHCLQDFSNNAQSLRVLTAHELGHNFSSFHDNNTDCIMSPSVNLATCWSNQSTNAINAYSGGLTGGCLSPCQTADPPPVADFSANSIDGCTPLVVQFTDNSSNNPDTWNWTFQGGDPATSADPNPIVTYNIAGNYSVILEVSNSVGTDTKTENNFINTSPIPTADFEPLIDMGMVEFVNTSQNGTSYFWDFGDGNTSMDFEPNHVYFQSGFYDVTFTAFNDCGQETIIRTIQIVFPPTADFTGNPISGCAPLVVNFMDLSTNIPENWFWTFEAGNPASSDFQNPTVEFPSPGTFSVSLDVFNLSGSDSYTITNYITVEGLPLSDFTFDINGLVVDFINYSTSSTTYFWDFGDGNSSTEINPTHTFAQGGNYDVTLIASNDCGTDEITQIVALTVLPQAAFGADFTSGCVPQTVNFTDQSISATSWSWDFPGGNPSSSTTQNPTVMYSAAGTYSVTLIASNGTGNSTVTETDYIVVAPLAVPDFTTSSDENTVTFTNTSTNATSYNWDFGDGTNSAEESPTHTYPDDGQYTVILTATNNCGTETIQQIVTTSSAPQAAFTSNVTSGCAPFFVSFTDGSTSNTTSWSWDFPGGNPSSSTTQNPTVMYSAAGTYSVTLIASNGTGNSTVTETDYIVVAPLSVPDFTTSSDENTVMFTNTSTNATSYSWDFGDGTNSTEESPTHTYPDDGQYTVILTATNTCGSETLPQIVTTSSAPQASFTSNVTSGCAPFSVSFTDGSTSNTTSWSWDFPGGNPSSSTTQNPTVMYSAAGTYSVTLIASNGTGNSTVTETDYIVVAPLAVPDFTTSSDENTVTFTNTSTNATSYNWDFGDGTNSAEESPTHTYPDDGQYTVILTATNNCGTETIQQIVMTSSAPQAAFTSNVTSGCAPFFVSFTDGSTSNTTSWSWSFPGGNPSSSSDQNPTVTYADAGTYSVTLVASNGTGNSTVTETDYIVIAPLAVPGFTTSSNENTVIFTNTSTNATSYSWDFGDGTNSIEENPTHTYADDGQYTVILTATNNCGTETIQQIVTTASAPQAAFTSSGTNGCAPFVVSFTDGSTSNTTSWSWSFPAGNPSSSSDQNPTVTYADAGTYSVTLVASNGTGNSTVTETDYIVIAPLAVPGFTTSSNENTVTFTNTSTNATSYNWDFGDGTNSTEESPTHTYPDDGQYTVILTATNTCGSETLPQIVTASSAPQAAFTSNVTSGCAPFSVSFTDGSTSNTTSWSWDFPDGNPSSSTTQNPTVMYPSAGTYSVTLIASNGTGNSTVTETDYIVVAPLAVPDFTTSSDENTVMFTNTSTNATSYSWDFGDGTNSTEESPTHTYPDDGQYTVILTATNTCGSETLPQIVTTSSAPQAAFTAQNNNGCGPLTVSFMDQSTENTTSWSWNFPGGNPSISTEQNPIVVYETAGIYTVTLVASNSSGTTTVNAVDFVNIASSPIPGFLTNIIGSQVAFTNTTVNGNQYSWDFGDGTTSTDMNPVHNYPMDGQYDVILTAENECGPMSTGVVTITIVSTPQAGFTAVTRSGCAPLMVDFQDESSENTTSWEWSFPGGTPATSTEQAPTVIYDIPGTYTVGLTVGNASGSNTLTQIDYVEIFAETVADFELTSVDDEISIVNNSTNATGFVWNFGDGMTSMEVNPMHIYAESGTYTVSLTAVGFCGAVTITQEIMITVTNIMDENRVSLFEVYPNPGSGNVTVTVKGEPTNHLEIRLVDALGRILYSENKNFTGSLIHEYDWTHLSAGTYIVQLRREDAIGYRKIVIEK